jgi:AcrR family transcriptional regulator
MSATNRQMRADARRNREKILSAAGELFAQRSAAVQMEEIAERAGLGMGTLYRHFATKQALLAAIIGRRFSAMAELARAADLIDDPGEAFETLLWTYLEAAEHDAAFRLALLGPEDPAWAEIAEQKAEFGEIAQRILGRAVAAGRVRSDLTFGDFVLITRGVMVNMTPDDDWRRHLTLALEGIRAPAEQPG